MTTITHTNKIPKPRRVMMEKIEKMEDRLRAVENAAIQTGAALASISTTLTEMKSMFSDSIKESKAVERRVDKVEQTNTAIATRLDSIEKAQQDVKKLAMKVAGVALAILLGLAGIKNVPMDAIMPEFGAPSAISRAE